MNINSLGDANRNSIVMQTAFRRELQGDLLKMGQMLREQADPDEMTNEIIDWHRMFTAALKKEVADSVLKRFIPLLQEILVDPISQTPLDEEAYLGSDGNTYGHKTLVLYKHGVPQNLKDRSPLNPEDPTVFTTRPHTVVRELVHWLKKHDALLKSEELDRLYEQLMRQIHPPKPVENRAERLKIIQARQERIQKERERELREFKERIRQEAAQEVQGAFQPIQERIVEIGAEQVARINELAAKDRERLEIVQNKLGNENPIQQGEAFQEQLIQVQNMVENSLEAQIEELEKGNDELNLNNAEIGSQINDVGNSCQEVQTQIHETKKERRKAKKAKIKQAFTAFGSIGLCVFATWAVMGIAASCGVSAAVTPINQGAMLSVGIAV